MGRYWALQPMPGAQAEYRRPSVGDVKFPGKWIIRYEESLLLSTVSLVRAEDRLRQGLEVLDLGVSDEHARVLSDVLGQTQSALEDLRELSQGGPSTEYRAWAQTLAHVLAQFESVTRKTGGGGEAAAGQQKPVGLSARPLLEVLAVYFNEHTGGAMLEDLRPEERRRLRNILVEMTVELGFALAGREPPAGVEKDLLEQLAAAEDPYAAEGQLAERLLDALERTGPPRSDSPRVSRVRSVLAAADKGLQVLKGFVDQWDRMDRVELALRGDEGDRAVLECLVAVRPGQEVRVANVMMFQPIVAFRGTTRISVRLSAPGTDEVVVRFDSVDAGSVELRFEGLVYGLARLLVLPIEDARMREVRVFVNRRAIGTQMVHVALLTEALRSHKDPRRMLVYQEVREKDIVRRPFSVEPVERSKERTFSYVTPTKRYTYYRQGIPEP